MTQPQLSIVSLGDGKYLINQPSGTVALLSSQGYIDWLLQSPDQQGRRYTEIVKETHLSYTLGLKLLLTTPHPGTEMTQFSYSLAPDGSRVTLTGTAATKDGTFTSLTHATLLLNPDTGRYEWQMDTTLSCTAPTPVELNGIEFNNVYPAKTGRCMLFAPTKEYASTLMADKDGVIWRFPHQHMLHYGGKCAGLNFAVGTWAGFFGDPAPAGCPVVTVHQSPLPPTWGICDMYYDLHCCANIHQNVHAGDAWRFVYTVEYLDRVESARRLNLSRAIAITRTDWTQHEYPRFELGFNSFTHNCNLADMDDSSGFRQQPPLKVWDREVGHRTKGSLRITNDAPQETQWSAEPPSQIPAETRLHITGMIKTQELEGKGAYLRVRYHTFVWHPKPHVEWVEAPCSTPVTGTTDGWVQVSVPELRVPREHLDYLVWIDFVLDGKGVAWLTDVDVDLLPCSEEPPCLQEGMPKPRRKATPQKAPTQRKLAGKRR